MIGRFNRAHKKSRKAAAESTPKEGNAAIGELAKIYQEHGVWERLPVAGSA